MSVFAGPNIALNDLVLHLDAADQSSYDGRENLLLYSEQVDNAAWGKNNATILANAAIGPFGAIAADRLTETSDVTAQYHSISQTITKPAASIQYTFSVYARTAGREILGLRMESGGAGVVYSINLNTGAVALSAGVYGTGFSGAVGTTTNLGGGWYRIAVTATTNTATSMFVQLYLQNASSSVYIGDGTSGVFVWGAQLERSSVATNYAETIASTISRGSAWNDLSLQRNTVTLSGSPAFLTYNSGVFNFDEVDDWAQVANTSLLSSTAYTKIAWFRPETSTSNLISGGTDGQHAFWLGTTSTTLAAGHNGAWTTVSFSPGSLLNQWWCGAVTYSNSTGWVLYLNGSPVSSNTTSTTTFTGTGVVRIGAYEAGFNLFDGDLPVIQVYNRALSNTEIRQNFNALRGRFGI